MHPRSFRRPAAAVPILLAAALIVTASPATAAQTRGLPGPYSAVDLGTLGGGAGTATALNDRGVVVGVSTTATGAEHAFVWRGGRMTDLGTLPGHVASRAVDVNRHGLIVGTSTAADGTTRAVSWRGGRITDLGTLGGLSSWAVDVNDRGQVLGLSEPAGDPPHRVIWRNTSVTDLGRQGFYESTTGINDRGDVVGTFDVPPNAYPCTCVGGRLRDGVVTPLRGSGRVMADATAINDRGAVLGHIGTANGWQPVLWRAGTIVDVDLIAGAESASGRSLNDRGDVLGETAPGDAPRRAFLWRDGVSTDLTTRGLTTSDFALDVNNRGQLAGARDGRPALFR